MQTQPLISVIIPTRNRKELLIYAVRSVLQQTYHNLQIIIHDNNSTDGTLSYLNERIDDPRVEVHHTDHDLVMTGNWNTAFRFVRGDYFVRLDDDNIFFNDLIEAALQEIAKLKLDVVTYSPLIIHLNQRVFSLFKPDNRTQVINKYQSLFLEYKALTDSNYTLYRTSLIRALFPDGNVYRGSLPDRFMNYTIADNMETMGIRVGVSPAIKGITRFDYRDSFSSDYRLRFVDYATVTPESVKKEMNVHNNFSIHRIVTIQEFFKDAKDQSLRRFFERSLTRSSMFLTVMRLGHIQRLTSAYSFDEYAVYVRYCLFIASALLRSPFSRVEGKSAWTFLVLVLKKFVVVTSASFKNLITHSTKRQSAANPKLGDSMIESFLEGRTSLNELSLPHIYGELGGLLKHVQSLETSAEV